MQLLAHSLAQTFLAHLLVCLTVMLLCMQVATLMAVHALHTYNFPNVMSHLLPLSKPFYKSIQEAKIVYAMHCILCIAACINCLVQSGI